MLLLALWIKALLISGTDIEAPADEINVADLNIIEMAEVQQSVEGKLCSAFKLETFSSNNS